MERWRDEDISGEDSAERFNARRCGVFARIASSPHIQGVLVEVAPGQRMSTHIITSITSITSCYQTFLWQSISTMSSPLFSFPTSYWQAEIPLFLANWLAKPYRPALARRIMGFPLAVQGPGTSTIEARVHTKPAFGDDRAREPTWADVSISPRPGFCSWFRWRCVTKLGMLRARSKISCAMMISSWH